MNEHACFCLFVRGSVLGRKFSPARGVCSVFVHEVVNNETTNEHDKHKIPEARLGYFRKKKADCHAKVILREISTGLSEPLILKIARNGSFETKCHVSRRCSCCSCLFAFLFMMGDVCLCLFSRLRRMFAKCSRAAVFAYVCLCSCSCGGLANSRHW